MQNYPQSHVSSEEVPTEIFWSEQDDYMIVDLLKSGKTISEISDELGLKAKFLMSALLRTVKRMIVRGSSSKEIAEKTGMTEIVAKRFMTMAPVAPASNH